MKRMLVVVTAVAALLAGCGGGSGLQPRPATPAPPSGGAGSAQAQLSISVPLKKAGSAEKRPAYVSPDTHSISFKVPSMSGAEIIALNLGSASCPQVGDAFVCTAYFDAPVGLAQSLTVKTFASADGSGTPLSENVASLDVKVGQVNPIHVTLNGVVATLGLYLAPNYVNAGTASSVTATFEGFDSAGDLIVGPGAYVDASNTAISPSLSTNDLTGAIAIGAYNASTSSWNVSYNGATIGSPNLTVSASGYTNASVPLTVYAAGTTPTPSPTPTATPTGGPTSTPAAGPTPVATPTAFGTPGASCDATAPHCGTERWHIKTLDDLYVPTINFTPIIADVNTLRNVPIPAGYTSTNDSTRYAPYETQVYRIRAVLLDWKIESDHDYHIVVGQVDNPANTMIVEPPDVTCNAACASNFGTYYSAVRTKLTSCFGQQPPGSVQPFPKSGVVVDITGVPFFDALHGQTGVAPNGIELHPVLSIDWVSGQPC